MIKFIPLYIISLISILFINNSFAYDTKVIVELPNNQKQWDLGEQKEIKISIYPITQIDDADLKSFLLNQDFVDMIKIVNVEKQYFNKNNPEYYTVECYAVLVKVPQNNFPKIWNYKDLAVAVDFQGVEFINTQAKIQDFVVINKTLSIKYSPLILTVIVLALVGLVGICIYIFRKYKHKKYLSEQYNKNLEVLVKASTRDEHEYIYANRTVYTSIVQDKDIFKQYLNSINNIQYKKKWTDSDIKNTNQLHSLVKENLIVR